MSLLQSALSDVGISVENFQDIPAEVIPAAVVDQPSVSIPLSEPVVESVVVPNAEEVVTGPGVLIEEIATLPEPAIDNAIAEHEMLQTKADQLVALQVAMERYETIVRKTGFGGITPQTAEVIQVHLQLSQASLGITTKVGSMESFSAKGPREQHDLATVTLESIRETAVKAGKDFIAAIEKIIDYLKRLGQNLFDGILHVESALKKLESQLASTKSTGGGEDDVLINTTMLDDGGVFTKGVPSKIVLLAQFTVVDYPMRVAKFFDDASKIVSSVSKDEDDLSEVMARLDDATTPLADIVEAKATSDRLPGGYELDVSDGGLSFGIKAVDNTAKSLLIKPGTTLELRKQVRELLALIETLKKIRPNTEKISVAGKKLLTTAKGAGHDEILSKAATYIHQSNPRVGEVIDYLVKYSKAQCVAIAVQIKAAGSADSGKTKASSASGKTDEADDLPNNPGYKNLRQYVEEGDVSLIRTALRLMFNDPELDSDELLEAKRWTMTKAADLFVPFTIKAFARDIDNNKSAWTYDYYGDQIVYLKTNYAEKRYDHIVKVRAYLIEKGEFF